MMKAIVLEEHGTIEFLKYKVDLRKPDLKGNEVRVKILYCGLNHLDLWLRKGGTGDKLSLPRIPGSDIVGFIAEVGESVKHLQAGDAVLLYPGKGCGHCSACINSRETMCPRFEIIGYHCDGGYAEYINIDARYAIKIRSENLREWAAVPVSYVTAWNALITKAKLKPTDTVAIWGATGGLGYAAMNIAQGIGAKVIAIVGSEDKEKFLQNQGFSGDIVIRSEHLLSEIRTITQKTGVDVVLDHVGKQTWNDSLKMLARGGRLAFCGVTTGPKVETDLRYIFGKQIEIYGSWMGDHRDLLEVVKFLENKPDKLPYIYQEYALNSAGDAQLTMEEGNHVGKIILAI